MYRKKMPKGKDKKKYHKSAKYTHPKNNQKYLPRGGFRFS